MGNALYLILEILAKGFPGKVARMVSSMNLRAGSTIFCCHTVFLISQKVCKNFQQTQDPCFRNIMPFPVFMTYQKFFEKNSIKQSPFPPDFSPGPPLQGAKMQIQTAKQNFWSLFLTISKTSFALTKNGKSYVFGDKRVEKLASSWIQHSSRKSICFFLWMKEEPQCAREHNENASIIRAMSTRRGMGVVSRRWWAG